MAATTFGGGIFGEAGLFGPSPSHCPGGFPGLHGPPLSPAAPPIPPTFSPPTAGGPSFPSPVAGTPAAVPTWGQVSGGAPGGLGNLRPTLRPPPASPSEPPAPWTGMSHDSMLQALLQHSQSTDRRLAELSASFHSRERDRDRERRNRSDSRDRDHRRRRRDQDRDRYRS